MAIPMVQAANYDCYGKRFGCLFIPRSGDRRIPFNKEGGGDAAQKPVLRKTPCFLSSGRAAGVGVTFRSGASEISSERDVVCPGLRVKIRISRCRDAGFMQP